MAAISHPPQPTRNRLNLLPHHQQLKPPVGDSLHPIDRAGELAVDSGGGVGVVAEVDGGERARFPARSCVERPERGF